MITGSSSSAVLASRHITIEAKEFRQIVALIMFRDKISVKKEISFGAKKNVQKLIFVLEFHILFLGLFVTELFALACDERDKWH